MTKSPNRKTQIIGCVLALFTLSCGSATAVAAQDQSGEIQIHRLEIVTEVSAITYKEPGLMEESGAMVGIGGSYTYRKGRSEERRVGKEGLRLCISRGSPYHYKQKTT